MKIFYSGLVVFLCVSSSAKAQQAISVQQHRTVHPAVFQNLPNSFEADQSAIRKAFSAAIGDTVRIQLSRRHAFTGVVIDKVQQSPTLLTINIRSFQFSGAMMHISLNTAPGVEQPLRSKIIHPKKGDVMVLLQENDKYVFRKEEQQFLLAE